MAQLKSCSWNKLLPNGFFNCGCWCYFSLLKLNMILETKIITWFRWIRLLRQHYLIGSRHWGVIIQWSWLFLKYCIFFYCIQISNFKDDLAKSCGLKKFNVSHSGQFRSPQHIPQVPALERSSVAAMVPGIWGLAIWGQQIDLAEKRTMAACRTFWIILEQRNIFFNKQLFFLSCPHLGFQSIDDNRESLWQELIFREDFHS